ncbi:DUF124-domain-containing protein [Cylindrobasidium torrendii FP15055 ss-10]|uniref:Altered inheritance of mitochondria protein 24, mitochondrial n=1 Tax=Cylindrobasidium torrendii FP15055 ss-10 TaxID=1314674 RepID=A0A0D7BDX3_9AGAR|nr:DUF124-domain-containing protein [Cylindrobasidium torrendii FP15055 ss-10]
MSHQMPMPGFAPSRSGPPAAGASGGAIIDTTGAFEGMQFRVDHRDSNSLLSVRLAPEYQIKGKPGSMVAMEGTVTIKGKMKFSFKKMIAGGEMSESIFSGPGEVMLAPDVWGDVVPINLDGSAEWSIGKDAFLACTMGVTRSTKSQGLGKALFSGEGLFVYNVSGQGIVFVQSLGAIVQKHLRPGEEWIVDNGHLVAWTAKYKVERIQAGGFLSGSHTDEGLVCRFVGPGSIYIQTRNPEVLGEWIQEQIPARQ